MDAICGERIAPWPVSAVELHGGVMSRHHHAVKDNQNYEKGFLPQRCGQNCSMAIPTYEELYRPLLELCSDGKERTLKQAINDLAEKLQLKPEELAELLPSGRQTRFRNRVGWAKSHLVRAGALEKPMRGVIRITPIGRDLLAKHAVISNKELMAFPGFVAFIRSDRKDKAEEEINDIDKQSPEEQLENAYASLENNLAQELLELIEKQSPKFFEQLVIDLMVKMGYGRRVGNQAGVHTGGSGDEGIDGLINEDKLGLDVIYLQAKRWKQTIGRPEIQKFVGALQGQRAKKGVFVTIGKFSQDAEEYVRNIEPRISLIDGEKLAKLMIEYDLGVSHERTYVLKRIDNDYFDED